MHTDNRKFISFSIVTGVLVFIWLVLQIWLSVSGKGSDTHVLTESFIRRECLVRGISLIKNGVGIIALLWIGALIATKVADSFTDNTILSMMTYIAYSFMVISVLVIGVFISMAAPHFSGDPHIEEVTVVSKDRKYVSGKQEEKILYSTGRWVGVSVSAYVDAQKGDIQYLLVSRGSILRIYTDEYTIGDDITVVRNDDPETMKLLNVYPIGETLPSEYYGEDVTWWTAVEIESETEPEGEDT